MIANLKSWWDLSLVAGCGLAVGLALFYRSSGKHSPVFPNEKKGPSAKHIQDRGKAALLGGVALAFVVSWLVASKLSRENAAMHLIGDDVLSPGLLAQIEALRSDWQIPGVSIAVVKMDEQDHWHKQTVGLGRRNGKGGRVTDEVSYHNSSALQSLIYGTKSLSDPFQYRFQLQAVYIDICWHRPLSSQLAMDDPCAVRPAGVPVDGSQGRPRDDGHRVA